MQGTTTEFTTSMQGSDSSNNMSVSLETLASRSDQIA
jgi:hypothetical protein